jgi:hypothetical protein
LNIYWIESYHKHNTKPNSPQNYWPYLKHINTNSIIETSNYLLVMNCLEISDNFFIIGMRRNYDWWNIFHLNNPIFVASSYNTKKKG